MTKLIHKVRKNVHELRREVSKHMLILATSSLGLVSALAWNELIKEMVEEYIKPIIGGNSGIISLLIYALLVTFLAVFTTYILTRLIRKKSS
jgi:hypothetical protein